MLKKKQFMMRSKTFSKSLKKTIFWMCTSSVYKLQKSNYSPMNNFSISHPKSQFWFTLFNMNLNFFKILSTGTILNQYVLKFKFFKKSKQSMNPLMFNLMLLYSNFLTKLYFIENSNYTKKSKILLDKLLSNIFMNAKFFLFSKTWTHVTKPVKSIKSSVLSLLKNS